MMFIPLDHPLSNPNQVAIWAYILASAFWIYRNWRKEEKEKKHTKKVEKELEKNWTNGDDTLSSKPNPGRSQIHLLEMVNEDLQLHKIETGRKFDQLIGDVGKIKGKLGIN